MSDREGPSGSGQKGDKEEKFSRTPSQPMPTGSRSSYYANEPIQFRVRGSTITGASPPKFVTLEDIMKAAHGMQNMALAHEIAVGQDFKLEPFEPPDNRLYANTKVLFNLIPILDSYFTNILQTHGSAQQLFVTANGRPHDLYEDPNKFDKEQNYDVTKLKPLLLYYGLFSILLPRHKRIREMIEEVLDHDFIKQQAENNSLDFNKYATFVVDLMGKLAAPARDEMIQNITKLTDTVDIFRAILETLEILKLDLANTLIAMIRPHVQQESVQYERTKFDELLKVSEATQKQQLKEKIIIILDNTSNDIELKSILPSVAAEIIVFTENLLEGLNQAALSGDTKELIQSQILSLSDPEHRVRQIVRQRIFEFLKEILVCGGGSRQIPVGLSAFTQELTSVSGTLLRYVMHNKAVFTKYYLDIVAEELKPLADRLLDLSEPLPDPEFFLELALEDALDPDALEDARDDAREDLRLAREVARELALELAFEPF
ncbi:T-complex protein 11-like protein 1 [Papilio machaon]|uniref:T-complex protein 11-like protein 1 n=1 Tax=Papilio machaon TaxID=76193 RepID=A0A194R887_PAPMA|nr:T-complex protein 11-like protein 1 [Papilio machaon]